MGAVVVAGRYVPRPPEDQPWGVESQPANLVLPRNGGNFPFVPTRWRFDHQDPDPGFVVESYPVARVQSLVGGNFPFKPNFWKQNFDDASFWQNESFGPSLVLELASNLPIGHSPRWKYDNNDPGVWSGSPTNVNPVLYLSIVAPFVPPRWKFDHDQNAYWVNESQPVSAPLLQQLLNNVPFKPPYWRYNNDDPGNWLARSTGVNRVIDLSLVNPLVPFRWRYDNDDSTTWFSKPGAIPASKMPVGGGYPFLPVAWRFNYDDASLWTVESFPKPPVQGLVGGGYPIKPSFWQYNNDDPGTWNGAPVNVSIVQNIVIGTPLVPQRWKLDNDDPAVWWGAPINVPITITQPGPPVPHVIGGVGLVGRSGKRWWEELEDEYRERYPELRPPSASKKAVKARKKVKEEVSEAVVHGLITADKAPDLIELAVKTYTAPTVDQALYYAEQVREYLNRLREDDEEDIMLMIWGMD